MILRRACMRVLLVLLAYQLSLAATVYAAQEQNVNGRVVLPAIPMGGGDSCVEDIAFMRRNHMDMLKHQRDETMLKGVRSVGYSLKECINCHAVIGEDALPVTVASPQHFCRSCHDYAAVSIDCFQCHASRPDPADFHANEVLPGAATVSGSQ